MLQAGPDMTLLVRERRAAQLAKTDLVVTSPNGDAMIATPPTVRGAPRLAVAAAHLATCEQRRARERKTN